MTGLLVSVRDRLEAADVLRAGVDLVDVKEPLAGPLGAASPRVWREVVDCVAGEVPVSLALGELLDEGLEERLAAVPAGTSYLKLGLAGCQDNDSWRSLWKDALAQLPAGPRPVAVIYADFPLARSPEPAEVLEAAQELGCPAVLVDTFDKRAGNLLAHWSYDRICQHVEQAQQRGIKVVLAGSLDERAVGLLAMPTVDLLAVRGAACAGERDGRLDPGKVARLVQLVQQRQATRAS